MPDTQTKLKLMRVRHRYAIYIAATDGTAANIWNPTKKCWGPRIILEPDEIIGHASDGDLKRNEVDLSSLRT